MRSLTLLLLLTHYLNIPLEAQHQNHNWYFGQNAGLNFSTSPPTLLEGELNTIEGNATISDPVGNLLFYTDGITIWDRNHTIMPNGTDLLGGHSSTQSALIVPIPNSFSKYFLFTTKEKGTGGGLYYSIVDMTLNGGYGDIITATKNTLILDGTAEKVTSIIHNNGYDIWILTHTKNSSEFFAYLITESGLSSSPIISSIGSFHPITAYLGPIKPSNSGQKIVLSSTEDNIVDMFDFNRSTGEITNFVNINSLLPQFQYIYGIEFSPNDSLLYLSSTAGDNDLYQIDLSTEEVTILNSSGPEYSYGSLQLGPDKKIYMARSKAEFIDIIHLPNLHGINCQYEESTIIFPKDIELFLGLPSYCVYSFFLPNTQILGRDSALCVGDSLDLSIDISQDCAPISIIWNDGSTDLQRTITQSGTYWVNIESLCGNLIDTIQVDILPCLPIVQYGLEGCESYMSNGTNMDYSEFTPVYPNLLACADVTASNVFRSAPQENKHSCTPGVNESIAMCISSHPSCNYEEGHQSSLIVEIQIIPHIDSVIILNGLTFFEKSPAMYSWIDGGSGLNNYPTKYGIRILKNGTEIFQKEEISTTSEWSLQSFDFLNDTAFRVSESSLFRIEFLPYCPISNGATVSAWDIDEISFFGGCIAPQGLNSSISGVVNTKEGKGIPKVEMQLANNPSFHNMNKDTTDAIGTYFFDLQILGSGYYLKGYKNDDVLNGVSAIDMIHIQKHLLGIAPFTSLHQYIAADVNRSGVVNVLDLIAMRKLLLGMISEFPGNTSWRFGCLPQDMSGKDINAFKEIFTIEELDDELELINFVGIKIGDLNGDAELRRATSIPPNN